jgi:2'-5' RNA ligase
MAPVRDPESQRVFFALWPDAPLQALLGELAREVAREGGGRPTAPHRIHLTLAAALHRSGFAVDDRPFAPHLTLARSAGHTLDRRLPQPLGWRVGSFILAVSELGHGGPTYRTLAEWPLTAG